METPLKTLWVFGCSFSFGVGCNKGDEYYELTESNRGKKFSTLLSEKYNLTVKDLSVPGTSNEMIIYRIIETIPLMNNGDLVVIGKTDPTRSYIFNSDYNWLRKNKNERDFFNRYIPLIPHHIEQFDRKYGFNKTFKEQITNIFYETRYRQSKNYREYYNDFFENVTSIIEGKCRVIDWDDREWKVFDTIKRDTKGKIEDGHFSWNGHRQLFNFLVEKINLKYPLNII